MRASEIEGNSLPYILVEPDDYDDKQEYPAIILLHGFGASMRDLVGLAPAIEKDGYLYLFPNAPIPMQIGPGMTGYAWTPPGQSGGDDAATRAEELLAGFFEEVMERHGLSEGGMVMGGFSQGGMMTYRFGLRRPDMFSGLVILSGRVPSPELLADNLPEHRDQPIFVAHGTQDAMIEVRAARESKDFLTSEGYSPQYREYEMAHEISQEVMADLALWLRNVMPPLKV